MDHSLNFALLTEEAEQVAEADVCWMQHFAQCELLPRAGAVGADVRVASQFKPQHNGARELQPLEKE